MLRLNFELTLLSEYHVSAGRRSNVTVDSALLRDFDATPVLRGTTLAGLLRDGLDDLVDLVKNEDLQNAVQKAKNESAARLFGTPFERKRWAYGSARPRARAREPRAKRWGSQDVIRVRRNPRLRRTEPQKLFSQEEGDSRLRFYFSVNCDTATALDKADAALLVAVARMVRHLGSARRRGRGECSISLIDATADGEAIWSSTDEGLKAFRKYWIDSDAPPEPKTVTSHSYDPTLTLAGPRLRFRMVARALEPILIARRAEAGNAYETLSNIPGSVILGALANRAALRWGLQKSENTPSNFTTLFLRDGVRSSGLLPAVYEPGGEGSLYVTFPAPQSLLSCENYPAYGPRAVFPHPVQDALADDTPEQLETCSVCAASGKKRESKLESISEYLTFQQYPSRFYPDYCEELHIRMDSGRAVTGDLFEYIALQAGQWFAGEFDCANQACWELLQKLTQVEADKPQQIRVGKAAQRGYGLLEFIIQPLSDSIASPLIPIDINKRIDNSDDMLRIFFLTDAIITDTWGRFYNGFDREWLAQVFQIDVSDINIHGELTSNRSVDSFNSHRNMPRWRDEAICAGSTARIKITPAGLQKIEIAWRGAESQPESASNPQLAALRWKAHQLECEGVGLRRNEGFGRLVFNHPIFYPDKDLVDDVSHAIDFTGSLSDLQAQLLEHLLLGEERFKSIWSEELDRNQRDQHTAWAKLDDQFEPVARLLFLSRFEELAVIKERLLAAENPSSEYLWGKILSARDTKPKLNPKALQLVKNLLSRLDSENPQRRAIGVALIAERIATVIGKRRANG